MDYRIRFRPAECLTAHLVWLSSGDSESSVAVRGVVLGVRRIHPEYSDSDPCDRSVAAEFVLRQEPDEEDEEEEEEEEEEEDEGDRKEDDEDEDADDGYSE